MRRAFTLIELLIVIAVIAVLSVVVVLVLNPAELLRQARDGQRLSDLATLQSAVQIYIVDTGANLGSSSTTYISIADASASTSFTQCQNLNLLSLASTSYSCTSSTKDVDGTGWIQVNFNTISAGSPLGALPIDPINQTSTDLSYDFTANGSNWQITALPESQKYKKSTSTQLLAFYPRVFSVGPVASLSPLFGTQSVLTYWNFDEGTGSTTADISGNGNTATLQGGVSWNASCVMNSCLTYNGSTGYTSSSASLSAGTLSAWINPTAFSSPGFIVGEKPGNFFWEFMQLAGTGNQKLEFQGGSAGSGDTVDSAASISPNTWTFVAATWDGRTASVFINGLFDSSTSVGTIGTTSVAFKTGAMKGTSNFFTGSIDDVRAYGRLLSPAEILALYNSEHP